MKLFLIRILFRLLRIPRVKREVDSARVKEWLGLQYPLQGFRDYISTRDLAILQSIGEGVGRPDYFSLLGQRIELGKLLTEAKNNFERAERERLKKKGK